MKICGNSNQGEFLRAREKRSFSVQNALVESTPNMETTVSIHFSILVQVCYLLIVKLLSVKAIVNKYDFVLRC